MKQEYLVYQIFTNTQEMKVTVGTCIRNVSAESKEEAIGKFVCDNEHRKGSVGLDIACFPIDELIRIE